MEKRTKRQYLFAKIKKDKAYYFMFFPVIVFLLVFNYAPMVGLINALFKFTPFKYEFIGFDNFIELFAGLKADNFWRAFRNTLFLSIVNLVIATLISVTVALLLNELVSKKFKSFTQTILYLPHFMSWIVAASIFTILLSPQSGLVNKLLRLVGIKPIYFLAKTEWWVPMYHFMTRWKETGWGTIIYLATLSGINPELYEASTIDGATRFQQVIHITIPAITTTIVIVFILNLGKIMELFQSVFALMNPAVWEVADVLQTFALRTGIQDARYGIGTAISFFSSIVGLILVLTTNEINKKIRGSSIL